MKKLLACLLIAASATGARAQQSDTLTLGAVTRAAYQSDPRLMQIDLQIAQTDLRLRNIASDKLPSISIEGQAQYQSTVTTIPVRVAGVPAFPSPPHDTYDGHVAAQQRIFDPTMSARRGVERATLRESNARVRSALYTRRQNVNDAFFTAALMQDRAAEIEAAIADLEARLSETETRLRERAALPGDAAALEAEILRRRQDVAELLSGRRASLNVLRDLTGSPMASSTVVALPLLSDQVSRMREATVGVRTRPEYDQFARTRERIAQQERLVRAQDKPRLSAFARGGIGRPGLNFLSNDFNPYWLAGVQFQWAPWTWGNNAREREALQLQQQIVVTEEASFNDTIVRATERDLAEMDRLQSALGTDDQIILLRGGIERETRIRYEAGVITAAEYLDRRNDVLAARLARATHRVQLVQAQANYLTTLGLEVGQ